MQIKQCTVLPARQITAWLSKKCFFEPRFDTQNRQLV